MKSKTGFTKSECLVVLGCAVFVLLNIAAIGHSGRKRAKEAICLSNLRKWGVILSQYAADNEGGTIEPWSKEYHDIWSALPDPKPPQGWWYVRLRPYLEDANDLLLCPVTIQPSREGRAVMNNNEFWVMGRRNNEITLKGSYGVNNWALNPRPEFTMLSISTPLKILPNKDHWHRMDVTGADNIPLVGGASFPMSWPYSEVDAPYRQPFDPWIDCPVVEMRNTCGGNIAGVEIMTFFWGRHNGATNMVFMDLSARKFSPKQLWSLKWNRVWNTCNAYTACGGVTPTDWPTWFQDFTEPTPLN